VLPPVLPLPLPVVPLELLPLPLPLSPPRPIELHALTPNANASMLAKATLWCLCFMIDSFCWIFSVGVRDNAACHFGKRREQGRRSS
jgi:hypothetical protein